jgi:sporulation protein YlmC with PRC-barrel domain
MEISMDIPVNAKVECTDGACGHSVYVLINPILGEVAHLVVKEHSSPNTEYIVPVEFISETADDTIRLSCSKATLEKMDPFNKKTFIEMEVPDRDFWYRGTYGMGQYFYMPYVTPDKTVYKSVEDQQIPPGELAVERGTRVEATDGYVGKVDEFVVNPENCHITHLVMREGHLWGQKDVIIPISAMGKTRGDIVFLKLDKHQVEGLPTFPLHRRWS